MKWPGRTLWASIAMVLIGGVALVLIGGRALQEHHDVRLLNNAPFDLQVRQAGGGRISFNMGLFRSYALLWTEYIVGKYKLRPGEAKSFQLTCFKVMFSCRSWYVIDEPHSTHNVVSQLTISAGDGRQVTNIELPQFLETLLSGKRLTSDTRLTIAVDAKTVKTYRTRIERD